MSKGADSATAPERKSKVRRDMFETVWQECVEVSWLGII
jgi:hypothetical protein